MPMLWFSDAVRTSTGSFEICPVCSWEDDDVQFDNPTYKGGANVESLEEAKNNFKSIGASSVRHLNEVRRPYENDFRKIVRESLKHVAYVPLVPYRLGLFFLG